LGAYELKHKTLVL